MGNTTNGEEAKQSTIVHDEGQVGHEKTKVVPWDVITTFNSEEDMIAKNERTVVNSIARAYQGRG